MISVFSGLKLNDSYTIVQLMSLEVNFISIFMQKCMKLETTHTSDWKLEGNKREHSQ